MVAINFYSWLVLFPALAWAVTTTVDDIDPQLQYTGSWTTIQDHTLDGGIKTNYYGGATHTTTTPGDSVTFTFTGTSITYYGDVDVDNADFTVQLDQTTTTHSAKAGGFNSNQVLFSSSGMANTQHTFTVTHKGASGEWMTLDRLVYDSDTAPTVVTSVATVTVKGGTTATNSMGLPATALSTISTTPTNSTALPLGAIVGIAVGAGVLLIILVAFLIIFLRRRHRLQANVQATQAIDFLHDPHQPQPHAPVAPVSQWTTTPFTYPTAGPSGGRYAPVPQNNSPVLSPTLSPAPVVPSLFPPSYDEVESTGPPSPHARSSTYDPYAETEYAPSSSAYAPSTAGFARAPSASSSGQQTYPVDRKVRPT